MADGVSDKDAVLTEFVPGEERPAAGEGSLKSPPSAFSSRPPPSGAGWHRRSVFSDTSTDSHFVPLTSWIPAISVDLVVVKGANTTSGG